MGPLTRYFHKNATPPPDDEPLPEPPRRPRRVRRAITWFLLAAAGTALLVFLLVGALVLAVRAIPDATILAKASEAFHAKTGGTLRIGGGTVSVLHGLDLRDVTIHVDGDTQAPALLKADRVRIAYDLPALFVGRLSIEDVHLYAPRIHLTQTDGAWNFAKLVPPAPKEDAPRPPPAPADQALSDKLPVSPASLLLPFKVAIHHVGVTDLAATVDMATTAPASHAHHEIKGLDLAVDVDWFWKASKATVVLKGHDGGRLTLRSTARAATGGHEASATVKLDQSLAFVNLADLDFGLALDVEEARAGNVRLTHLPVAVSLKAHVPSALNGLRLDRFDLRAVDVLTYRLQGNIGLPRGTPDYFLLDLTQTVDVDLDAANRFAALAKIPVQTSGFLRIPSFTVEGPLDMKALQGTLNFSQLPSVALAVEMDRINAASKEWGFQLKDLNGKTSVSTRATPAGPGLQAEVDSRLSFAAFSFRKAIKGQTHAARVVDFSNRVSLRAQYPSLEVPFVRLRTAAKTIEASRGPHEKIAVPLKVDVQASAGGALSVFDATVRANLGDLLQFALEASCDDRCRSFNFREDLRLPSLARLYALAKPFASAALPAAQVPERVEGRVQVTAEGEGSLKDPKEKDVAKLVQGLKVRFGVQAAVEDVSARVPFMGVALDRFNVRVAVDGDQKTQKVELTQNFAAVRATIPAGGKEVPVSVGQFNLSTLVYNTLTRLDDLKNLPRFTETRLDTKLSIGKTSAPGLLPAEVSGLAFALGVEQKGVETVDVTALTLTVPDLGTDVSASVKAKLKPDRTPASFAAKAALGVRNLDNLALPSALKVKGQLGVNVEASSEDMNLFAVRGKSSFDHFNVLVPGPRPDVPPLLDLADMDGEIPFEQDINLKAYQEVLAKLKKQAGAPADAAPADALAEFLGRNRRGEEVNSVLPRVDYGNTRDFFPERKPLTIRKVSAANLTLRDMEFDVEVKKDRFAVNNFLVNTLDGKVQGAMLVGMTPLPQSVKVAVHMTKLNTEKLLENFPNLRGKTGGFLLGSDPILEGAVHLDYDIAQNDMGGGVEITKIGKDQLKMILYYLDPEEKDATLGNIRKALYVGNVTKVSVPIKNGYIGLDVGVSVLAVPVPLPKLNRFPIAQLVSNIRASQHGAAAPTTALEAPAEEGTPDAQGTH